MKTQSLAFQVPKTQAARHSPWAEIGLDVVTRKTARWAVAVAAGLAILITVTWAATTPAAAQALAGLIWGAGFIFFALALEVRIKRVMPYILTGMALPALAVMGSRVAEEFSIIAGAIIAGWMATWLIRRG